MRRFQLAVVAGFAALASQAYGALATPPPAAPVETTTQLVAACESEPAWCRSTLIGDIYLAVGLHEICIPAGTTTEAAIDTVVQWLKMRADLADMPWIDTVDIAYKAVWPCGGAK